MTDQTSSKPEAPRPGAQQMRSSQGCGASRSGAHPMRSPKGSGTSRPGAQEIRIEIGGHYARMNLPPELVTAASSVLELTVPCFGQGGPNGHHQYSQTDSYYVIDKAGRIKFPAGLVSRFVTFLQEHGYQVTVTDQTSWPQYEGADTSLLEVPWLESDDKALLEAIQQNPRGQLHMRRQDDLVHRIGLLGDFFPKANIAVVTANNEQAKRLFDRLRQHTNRQLSLSPQTDWQQGRMFICPAATFVMFAPRDWDVLIFVGDEVALGKCVQETLVEMDEQLRYVFVDQNACIGPRTQFRLEVFFGTVIYQQPDPYCAPAEVNVVFIASPTITPNQRLTGLERKRKLIWHNTERNYAVARIAEAVEYGDVAALEEYGVPTSAIAALNAQRPAQLGVTILVESTEHGQYLQRLLPGWHLARLVPESAQKGVKFTDCSYAANHATICTMVYAEEHGIVSDVLVRADGGDDWPLSANRFPWRATAAGDSALVIDLADDVGGRGTCSLKRRIRAYQRRRWHIQAVPDPHDGAVAGA